MTFPTKYVIAEPLYEQIKTVLQWRATQPNFPHFNCSVDLPVELFVRKMIGEQLELRERQYEIYFSHVELVDGDRPAVVYTSDDPYLDSSACANDGFIYVRVYAD